MPVFYIILGALVLCIMAAIGVWQMELEQDKINKKEKK